MPEDLFRPSLEGAHHYAYIVESIEATVERLAKQLGAGPFFLVENVPLENITSRGEPAEFVHHSAFGYCGGGPIELMGDSPPRSGADRGPLLRRPTGGSSRRLGGAAGISKGPSARTRGPRATGVPQRPARRTRHHLPRRVRLVGPRHRDPRRQPGTARLFPDGARGRRGLGRVGTASSRRHLTRDHGRCQTILTKRDGIGRRIRLVVRFVPIARVSNGDRAVAIDVVVDRVTVLRSLGATVREPFPPDTGCACDVESVVRPGHSAWIPDGERLALVEAQHDHLVAPFDVG